MKTIAIACREYTQILVFLLGTFTAKMVLLQGAIFSCFQGIGMDIAPWGVTETPYFLQCSACLLDIIMHCRAFSDDNIRK